jgi:hypothetical protein
MATGPLPGTGASELERLRTTVSTYFPVYETRVGPQSLVLAVHTDPKTLETRFDQLRQELWTKGYVPLLHRNAGEDFIEVVRRPKVGATRPWVNWVLLAATFATTTFAGGLIWLTYVGGNQLGAVDFAYGALYFSGPVLLILGLHESAHYLVARRRHLDASFPFFIPIPPPFIFGTFGAFISVREPFPDRKALFDVGAAGPLAGFAASIPIAVTGLFLSAHSPVIAANYCGPTVLGQSYANLLIGPTLFWELLGLLVPKVVLLHPLALAGWVGLLVTSINLLPAGSLDGGHVFRALLGDRARYVSYAAALFLFGLAFVSGYYTWILFAVLVLFLGLRHPPPLNDLSPLDAKRYLLGAFVAVVLVSGFALVPLAEPAGTLHLTDAGVSGTSSVPPGDQVAANLSITVQNGDPVAHGYLETVGFTNVTVSGPNGTEYLNGSQIAAWAANATWTFFSPNGSVLANGTGPSAGLPGADYVTIAGGASVRLGVSFANSETALQADVGLTVTQLCALSGTGSQSTSFAVVFP